MKYVFVTGDGPCPWCGKLIECDKPETHHTHVVDEEGKRLDP